MTPDQLTPLPIDHVLPDVLTGIREHSAVVIQAPAGSGKTTRVPPAILEDVESSKGRVVVLQPRRIAVRAACRQVAHERSWQVGQEVGYQVRFDRRWSPATRLLFVTEGVLLRWLQDDPFLEDISVVILDEFHERTLEADLALAILLQLQRNVRLDLRLVVMSATMDPQRVADHLGDCQVVTATGRPHPVSITYMPSHGRNRLEARVLQGVAFCLNRTEGDLLVFLPGLAEIRRAEEVLATIAQEHDIEVAILHGSLSAQSQDAALVPGPRRKIVLSTNVAETSLTVEGVEAVVDSGLARVLRFDAAIGLNRLEVEPISKAAADQRAGRAGRLRPGLCVRLWSRSDHTGRLDAESPAIHRVDLSGAILQLLDGGEREPLGLPWFETPGEEAVRQALQLLEQLEAVGGGGLTELGRDLACLPLHPRLGRLVCEGHRRGVLQRAALLASMLSERDPFYRPASRSGFDFEGRKDPDPPVDVLERLAWLEEEPTPDTETRPISIDFAAKRFVSKACDHLVSAALDRLGPEREANEDLDAAIGKALLAAFPDRLARRRTDDPSRAVMVGGRGLKLTQSGAELYGELFVALDIDAGPRRERSEALVRMACSIQREWLGALHVHREERIEFDPESKRVVATETVRYLDLVLEERPLPLLDEQAAAHCLAESASQQLDAALPLENPKVAQFLQRVRFLGHWMLELHLPRFDEAFLRELLPTLCCGRRSFDELKQIELHRILSGLLDGR